MTGEEIVPRDREFLDGQFAEQIFPVLTPLAIDPAHPFPFIPNLGFTIALQLTNKRDGKSFSALIPVPPQLKRFIRLPDTEPKDVRFIPLEHVIALYFDRLFPGHDVSGWGMFRILRDSDVEVEEEAEDLVLLFESLLKRRRRGSVIHMKCSESMPEELAPFHRRASRPGRFGDRHRRESDGPVGPVQADPARAPRPAVQALYPALSRTHPRPWRRLFRRHPRKGPDRPSSVREFRHGGAVPPPGRRRSRCGGDQADALSHLIRQPHRSALIEAAEAGKSVTALVELKARFDEAANIKWARDLERAGVQVVYGFIALKTHAKISLVVRREGGQLRTYCHFGTGNYHPDTAKIYTDLSLFSADPALGRDAAQLFNFITGYAEPGGAGKARHVAVHPARAADRGHPAGNHARPRRQARRISGSSSTPWWIPAMIDGLYRASQAGVKVELIVRGICCLRPGVPGLSDNIRVKSIVGRFLEHGRIVCFGNGHGLPHKEPRSIFPRPTGCRATWTAAWKPWFPSKIPPSINRSSTRSWWRS